MHKEFEQVVSDNQGRIRHIVSRYCRPNEFEDLYQEILVQLWRSFDSFKGSSSRETWLYKVALNTACTFVGKSIKQKELQAALSVITKSEGQSGQENCQADILNSFMNTLSDIDANILMMYLDGLSSEETAEVVGISANAIRMRVKRIKIAFEHQHIGEES